MSNLSKLKDMTSATTTTLLLFMLASFYFDR
jgi:hypothetical protein